MMDKGNAYHPTGNAKADGVRVRVEGVIAYVRAQTASGGPEAKRAAALAVTNFQQGSMWAERALTAEDAVEGDDGGAKGADRTQGGVSDRSEKTSEIEERGDGTSA
jgi:hypothetical protein